MKKRKLQKLCSKLWMFILVAVHDRHENIWDLFAWVRLRTVKSLCLHVSLCEWNQQVVEMQKKEKKKIGKKAEWSTAVKTPGKISAPIWISWL